MERNKRRTFHLQLLNEMDMIQ